MKKKEAGKGSWPPRNVGKKFQQNFPEIDWQRRVHAHKALDKKTSTARIYTYKSSKSTLLLCPSPYCENGGVDSGGFTPAGSPIMVACGVCKGTGKITQEDYDAMLEST